MDSPRNKLQFYIGKLYRRISEGEHIQSSPKLSLVYDSENQAQDPLGKTAYYDVQRRTIKVYISGRLIVDILRSFAHECIHHVQNERGDLDVIDSSQGYAQTNPHMRKMEEEAFLKGSLYLRDFQDELRK